MLDGETGQHSYFISDHTIGDRASSMCRGHSTPGGQVLVVPEPRRGLKIVDRSPTTQPNPCIQSLKDQSSPAGSLTEVV